VARLTTVTAAQQEQLRRQDGVVSVAQLVAGGYSRRAVDKRIERGRWRRLLPGIVLTGSGEPTRRQLLVAAWLWGGSGSAIDGADACAWFGLPVDSRREVVHVVSPFGAPSRSHGFVVVRRTVGEISVGGTGIVPYVDVSTALVVAARNARTEREAVAILSRGLQRGLATTESLRTAREAIGDKWCRGVDAALVSGGVGLRSPAEQDMADLITASRVLPEPRWNQWLHLGDGLGAVCVDALFDDAALVNEVDGKRYHAWGERHDKTSARHERLTSAGLTVLHPTPIRIRREGGVVLRNLEATYLRYAGRGMPTGVQLIDPPTIAA
jgi:hypothetical protein